jgi:hypothetical protein
MFTALSYRATSNNHGWTDHHCRTNNHHHGSTNDNDHCRTV